MTHRFPIKEIARQAGLGTATVDRVLNGRAHVSPQTKLRVDAAVEELAAQEAQLAARGRRLFFDFVIEAPSRFSREVKLATEAILPGIGVAVCRPRFLLQEIMEEDDVVAALARILRRGSHGVCLKARDTPKIRAAVARLSAARIPVVTLVTDIGGSDRLVYVGLDNAGAGRTAGGLVAATIGNTNGTILATRSHDRFLGEEAREEAFSAALAEFCPRLRILSVQGGSGVPFATSKILQQALRSVPDLRGVYSMGGGNPAIWEVIDDYGLKPDVFVAHDLDRDNYALLTERRLTFVLHHDLRVDIGQAFSAFLAYHNLARFGPEDPVSTVQIVTPDNIPARFRDPWL